MKIIIIGGGIGGLMTAIALNRKGIPALIYEKAEFHDNSGAGLAIWPNATCVLQKFGLLEKLLKYGSILSEMKTSTSKGTPLSTVRLKKLEDKFHFPSIVIQRMDLQKELLNAIPSSQIIFNKQYTKLENVKDKVNVHFTDGSFDTADCIIFADGVHSLARENIFNLLPLIYAGRTSWRGIAQFKKPFFLDNTGFEILGKGRRFGIFPLPGNSVYWYAAVNMPEEKAMQQNRTRECVLSHYKNWAEPVNSLIENTPEERLILTNINYTSDINKLALGNIALLGDAAHPMTPDLGQGACQAIEDANVIAECLSEKGSVEENLINYENKRLGRVRSIAKNSFRMGKLRQIESPIGLAIRNNLFKILPEAIALKMIARNIITEI